MSPATQWCAVHANRPAFARCMSCAKTLCQECATQWDGIWHCATCLAAKRGAKVERSTVRSWLGFLLLTVLLLYLGARLRVWTGAVFAGLLS